MQEIIFIVLSKINLLRMKMMKKKKFIMLIRNQKNTKKMFKIKMKKKKKKKSLMMKINYGIYLIKNMMKYLIIQKMKTIKKNLKNFLMIFPIK